MIERGRKQLKNILISLKRALVYTAFLWFFFSLSAIFGWDRYGIIPRTRIGLIGIVISPWLHLNYRHILSNTVPFFLVTFLGHYYHRRLFYVGSAFVWILSGLFVWVFGRPNTNHIGASAYILGMSSFYITLSFYHKNPKIILISLIIVLYQGLGLFLPLFPIDPQISYEGHIGGFLSGILTALITRDWGRQ